MECLNTLYGDTVRTHVPESTSSTRENNPLAWAGLAIFQCTVNSDPLRKYFDMKREQWMTLGKLTAQRMDAAAALSILSGMGVTELT